ncbi:hypothetical protein EBR78_07710 [bacterium]|nr:hypothetical protein [bacterium]
MLYLQTNQAKTIRSFNPIIMIGLFLVLLLVRTTTFWIAPSVFSNWDLLLPFMVYYGQRRPLFEGLLLWFVLAHLYTLQSVAPVGVFIIYYLLIFVVSRLISEAFFADSGMSILGLMAVLVFLSRIILPLVAGAFNSGWGLWSWNNLHPGILGLNIVLGWLCYLGLGVIDQLTFKGPREILDLGEGIA